ncbi:MAG: thiamine-phosphate kinase [Verrucomicrobia bacterium]|nr:thiamine-phosphate kinase [Verrucomicrobiota bacterium]
MNEFTLIERLTHGVPTNAAVVVGPGDDCAVLDFGFADRWLLLKTDAVVEGIHYSEATPPERVGHKALARCLSDIAAMAGTPVAALVTLALPPHFDPGYLSDVYAGINALARRHAVAVVGGETTTNPDRTLISVCLVGTALKDKCPLRSAARPGDAVFVTGELGGSLAGRHLEFEPRLVEARWLVERFSIHAMIDLSDGLASDLRQVLEASRVGAELLASAIPISPAAKRAARGANSAKAPLTAALTEGEDFELLFTLPSRDAVPLADAWKQQHPALKLSCIGRITAEPGMNLRTREGLRPVTEHGYIHFEKSRSHHRAG